MFAELMQAARSLPRLALQQLHRRCRLPLSVPCKWDSSPWTLQRRW